MRGSHEINGKVGRLDRAAWGRGGGGGIPQSPPLSLRSLDELASRVSVGILNENLSNKYWRWCGSRCSFLLVCRLTDLGLSRATCTCIIIDRTRAMRIRHAVRYAFELGFGWMEANWTFFFLFFSKYPLSSLLLETTRTAKDRSSALSFNLTHLFRACISQVL